MTRLAGGSGTGVPHVGWNAILEASPCLAGLPCWCAAAAAACFDSDTGTEVKDSERELVMVVRFLVGLLAANLFDTETEAERARQAHIVNGPLTAPTVLGLPNA